MPDVRPFAANPTEAIAFLRDKIDLPTETWSDIWQGMHARAFVIAGAQNKQLLSDFHDAVNRAIEDGTTLEQFRQDFDKIIETHGWSYKGSRGWRSRVIFNTNLRNAYAAGKWAQIQRVKAQRPYLRYVHADPELKQKYSRPEHAKWHDVVLPVDHNWWRSHFSPNGWGCRCQVQSLNERDLKRYGLKISKRAPPSPLVDHTIQTPSGPVIVQAPKGIAPGFAYNVGEAAFGRATATRAQEAHGPWEALSAPGELQITLDPLPLDTPKRGPGKGVRPGNEKGFRQALRDALGGDDLIVADPLGDRVSLNQAIVDHLLDNETRQDGRERYFPLIPELVSDPAEIWVGWAQSTKSRRVVLRRRYIKLIKISKGRTIGLVADADNGHWSGLTFFRGRPRAKSNIRSGLRIYRRP